MGLPGPFNRERVVFQTNDAEQIEYPHAKE